MTAIEKVVDYYSNPTPMGMPISAPVQTPPPANTPATTPTLSDPLIDDVNNLIAQGQKPAAPVSATVTPAAPAAPAAAPVTPPPAAAPVTPPPAATPPVATPPVAPVVPAAPTSYEITLADNSPLTDEDLNDIVKIAETRRLTKEETEELVKNKEAVYHRGVSSTIAKGQEYLKKQQEAYLADPLFSTPEAMEKSNARIDAVVAKFGPGLKKTLQGPLGNDIELARFLHNLGSTMEQDEIRGKGQGPGITPQNTEEALARQQYPEHFA